ncbi:hypothetical protein [Chryseobacterium jejuense]|uniref:Uncharacterized protein n=1 Tax=Chryseobacterium jejuense TaxID=445960 RepID=A0A2X2VJR8_CHRJE|nr:hypothetical protein [Chryseobacterium jejuense]SDI99219.1 hypothetical protein SAMN05421542_2506 [Chryseobacterium jejuense]SQB27037.1 Uncharacterised protein [Chryseobacterium jejuense]
MYSISKKIKIGKKALLKKDRFINDDAIPAAIVQFTCSECNHENTVEISPYQSGFPILQIYNEGKVLSKSDLLGNQMTTETSQRMQHYGELTVNDLPTLYFGTHCISCNTNYICVFSYGEKQPSLEILNISGIWEYQEVE